MKNRKKHDAPGANDEHSESAENTDAFDKTWKPESEVETKLTPFGFNFSLGIPCPPRKPDDEPLQ